MKLASGEDLKPKMEFIHPDDDNAEDKTVFRVPLSKPLAPGETIVVNIDFTGKMPDPPIARNGAKDDFFYFGQWFPKIGVYIDGKWNCHQYHSHTEFFADYGVYNVKITVPEKDIVGATGLQVSRTSNGDGTATHFYHAEDVHDFAWTTSPKFIEVKGRQNNVDIRILLQTAHKGQGQRHLDAAKLAIKYFESWYGDYPYPNLTVVDPAPGAGEVGGMEYPTIITAGTLRLMPKGIHELEMVIIHEFGHNYWYHMVGSNEFEESWLDEGINTYSEIQITHDIYGAKTSMVDWLGLKMDDMQFRRADYYNAPDYDPIVRNGWQVLQRRKLRVQLLFQAGAHAHHARELPGQGNHEQDHARMARALPLQTSALAGFRESGLRSLRPGPELVFQPGALLQCDPGLRGHGRVQQGNQARAGV